MSAADAQPTSLRHHRPFALYWVSRVSSTVAMQMQAVAVAWQMYDITHNPLDLGLVGLIQFIPAALFVLVAGELERLTGEAEGVTIGVVTTRGKSAGHRRSAVARPAPARGTSAGRWRAGTPRHQ